MKKNLKLDSLTYFYLKDLFYTRRNKLNIYMTYYLQKLQKCFRIFKLRCHWNTQNGWLCSYLKIALSMFQTEKITQSIGMPAVFQ